MEMNPTAMRALGRMLEARTGQQLSAARSWRLELALASLMQARGMASLDAVAERALSGLDPALADAVIDALLNNETSFFRDAAAFATLADEVLPALRARRGTRRLKIWCAGCSTGQEAYSLAMSMIARMPGVPVDIAATDISRSAIARARAGEYAQIEIQRGLGVRLMLDWFEPLPDGGWRARRALRARVRFEVRSLLDPPPLAGAFDLVLCRNVLLYFDGARRRIAFDRLAEAIAPDGLLMLGAGETASGHTQRFTIDPKLRGVYRQVPGTAAQAPAAALRSAAGAR